MGALVLAIIGISMYVARSRRKARAAAQAAKKRAVRLRSKSKKNKSTIAKLKDGCGAKGVAIGSLVGLASLVGLWKYYDGAEEAKSNSDYGSPTTQATNYTGMILYYGIGLYVVYWLLPKEWRTRIRSWLSSCCCGNKQSDGVTGRDRGGGLGPSYRRQIEEDYPSCDWDDGLNRFLKSLDAVPADKLVNRKMPGGDKKALLRKLFKQYIDGLKLFERLAGFKGKMTRHGIALGGLRSPFKPFQFPPITNWHYDHFKTGSFEECMSRVPTGLCKMSKGSGNFLDASKIVILCEGPGGHQNFRCPMVKPHGCPRRNGPNTNGQL